MRRADGRVDAADTVEEKSNGDRRSSSPGLAVVFWQCPGSGPDCSVVIEMEHGATLGYRRAVLLNEIPTLGSLSKAAKVSKNDRKHAKLLSGFQDLRFTNK
jgi:hypothetical protein